jgi:hypothetical protein
MAIFNLKFQGNNFNKNHKVRYVHGHGAFRNNRLSTAQMRGYAENTLKERSRSEGCGGYGEELREGCLGKH